MMFMIFIADRRRERALGQDKKTRRSLSAESTRRRRRKTCALTLRGSGRSSRPFSFRGSSLTGRYTGVSGSSPSPALPSPERYTQGLYCSFRPEFDIPWQHRMHVVLKSIVQFLLPRCATSGSTRPGTSVPTATARTGSRPCPTPSLSPESSGARRSSKAGRKEGRRGRLSRWCRTRRGTHKPKIRTASSGGAPRHHRRGGGTRVRRRGRRGIAGIGVGRARVAGPSRGETVGVAAAGVRQVLRGETWREIEYKL